MNEIKFTLANIHKDDKFCFPFLLSFIRPHPWHMDIPRLGIKLEVGPLAYATATVKPDLSSICNLHHSSGTLNPLSEAMDQTCVLMATSQINFC